MCMTAKTTACTDEWAAISDLVLGAYALNLSRDFPDRCVLYRHLKPFRVQMCLVLHFQCRFPNTVEEESLQPSILTAMHARMYASLTSVFSGKAQSKRLPILASNATVVVWSPLQVPSLNRIVSAFSMFRVSTAATFLVLA
jgi:hypothetical protein